MATGATWTCTVCGYVHTGDAPPAECPVCGAAASAFERTPTEVAAAAPIVMQWECAVCGYVHDGPNPPAECPVCGADASQFKPLVKAASGAVAGESRRIIIVGAGIAGVAAAEAAREASADAQVVLLSAESELPYYRLNLTRYLAGEIGRDELTMHEQAWYSERRIELQLSTEVARLHTQDRAVELKSGERLTYDRLVLTNGAHPFVPPVDGAELPGVMSLRTMAHADELLRLATAGKRVLCVGGGLLGLETAGALARRGAAVTVLESHGYLMPQQMDRTAGAVLGRHVASLGVTLLSGVHLKAIEGDGCCREVLLEEGPRVAAHVVVLATGVRSTTYLAREANLEVKRGIVVNSELFTSDPSVLAAGDVAEHLGVTYGNWAVAQMQGRVAGRNAAGGHEEFPGVPRSHTLKILGLDTCSIGQFNAPDGSYRQLSSEEGGRYLSFVFKDGAMVGSNLVGDDTLAPAVRSAIESGRSFAEILARSPSAGAVAASLKAIAPGESQVTS